MQPRSIIRTSNNETSLKLGALKALVGEMVSQIPNNSSNEKNIDEKLNTIIYMESSKTEKNTGLNREKSTI